MGASDTDGPTMDNQIIRDLMTHCIEASEALGVDADFRKQAGEIRAKLPPNQIGAQGQLQEWLEDWDAKAPDQHHRHVSHLYGFYPGENISYSQNPDLVAAVKKSLENRGDEATGWGLVWRLNLWARLHDGAHAYKILQNLLTAAKPDPTAKDRSGTYNNMFDAHPPFQIDGNFGGAAGIVEMLMQSNDGVIELLPALPPAFEEGSVTGLRARGGYEVSLSWAHGALAGAEIKNISGKAECDVRYNGRVEKMDIPVGSMKRIVLTPF
jgi:alpha-L-fucosidase 2